MKQQRQLATSRRHLAQELLANIQCSGGSRSFAKQTRALDEERSGWLQEADSDQWKETIKVDPLTTTQEVAEKLSVTHFMVIWHLKQSGKKKLNKGCLVSGLKIKTIVILKSHLLLFYSAMNHF